MALAVLMSLGVWEVGEFKFAYIRPIQVDICLGDVEDDEEHTEECLLCKVSLPLRQMRAHMEECPICLLFSC